MPLQKLLTQITKIILGVIVVIYPFVVFYALESHVAVRFVGLFLLALIVLSFTKNKNKVIFALGVVLCSLVIFLNQPWFLKLYPVLMNSTICAIFALSLNKTPIITKQAMLAHKQPLDNKTKTYTKHATLAWAIFMACNTIVSFITVFLPDVYWVWYNGFISYILIGTMMLCEFFIRKVIVHV